MKKIIKIPSKIDSLRNVEKIIDEVSNDYKINEDLYGNILIASLEAVNNAIVHGNKLDENKKVIIEFKLNDKEMTISVNDDGSGFDYENIPDPTAPENIENINGRGIFLMKKLSDGIKFSNNGARVELLFNLK